MLATARQTCDNDTSSMPSGTARSGAIAHICTAKAPAKREKAVASKMTPPPAAPRAETPSKATPSCDHAQHLEHRQLPLHLLPPPRPSQATGRSPRCDSPRAVSQGAPLFYRSQELSRHSCLFSRDRPRLRSRRAQQAPQHHLVLRPLPL